MDDKKRDRSGSRTENAEQPPAVIPDQDIRRKREAPQSGATGSGSDNPVERTPAENPKEHGLGLAEGLRTGGKGPASPPDRGRDPGRGQ